MRYLALISIIAGCTSANPEYTPTVAVVVYPEDMGGSFDSLSTIDQQLYGCSKDTDCKGTRICVENACVFAPMPDLVVLGDMEDVVADLAPIVVAPDMLVLPDALSLPDQTVLPDQLYHLPDLTLLPDLTTLPDLTAKPDLTNQFYCSRDTDCPGFPNLGCHNGVCLPSCGSAGGVQCLTSSSNIVCQASYRVASYDCFICCTT